MTFGMDSHDEKYAPHVTMEEATSGQEMFSRQCSLMLALSVPSFMFIYNIWWMILFTICIASVGYYAAEMIKMESHWTMTSDVLGSGLNVHANKTRANRQVMFAEFFYYASFLVLAFQCSGEVMLLVSMTIDMTYSPKNGWEVACILLGSVFIVALVYTTYRANLACRAFLEERKLNPSHHPLLTQDILRASSRTEL